MAVGIAAADLRAGDVVRLKKAHPCGGYLWRVQRAGGDIGLRCETCGHHIMMPRFRIERRIRYATRPDDSGNPAAVAQSDSVPSDGNPSD